MSEAFPELEVAIACVTCGEEILTVYDPRWGGFTLPMTKVREWDRSWADAAARAAAEALGRTITDDEFDPALALDRPQFQFGMRTGTIRHYHFQVFRVRLDAKGTPPATAETEWLTKEALLGESHRPLSPTVSDVIKKLDAEAKLKGGTFP